MKVFTKISIFILLSVSLFADNYYEHNLFKVFKIVSPKDIKKVNSYFYISKDEIENIAFVSKVLPSGLEYDIETYNKTIKDAFDKTTLAGVKIVNSSSITDFSSKLEKDRYIGDIFYSQNIDGVLTYFFKRKIAYKKNMYEWTIISQDEKKGKMIFNNYKDYITIIK